MEALSLSSASLTINKSSLSSSSSASSSPFSPKKPARTHLLRFPVACKGRQDDSDGGFDRNEMGLVPIVNSQPPLLSPLSKDVAMGLVLSAATGRGWTTGSGMEGPPEPVGDAGSSTANISTFPWSLFTKSPRRRMLIAFTCNICSQRTTRAINPHAYTDGTVFVQCCGCNAYHKLVDNLNLFEGMSCYISSSFKHGGNGTDGVSFEHRDGDNGDDGFFGM